METHNSPSSPHLKPRRKICAVVTTYEPEITLVRTLATIESQTDRILLIDNSSGKPSEDLLQDLAQCSRFDFIHNEVNVGVGRALNQAILWVRSNGYKWALILDQDSEPASDMLNEQLAALDSLTDPETVAIIAPSVIDAGVGREAPFLRKRIGPAYRRSTCDKTVLEDVTTVITSGSLMRLSALEKIGGFREDFFIDYVDTEFCLRARSLGYRIAVACRAKLYHRLGNRKEVRVGPIRLYPTFHPPTRWYTISRNRVPMIRQWGLKFPHWLTYELVASAFTFLRMLATEDQKLAKLRAILRGTWDGVRGKMGSPPSAIG